MKKAVNVAIGRYIVANKAYNHYCLVCNHKDEDIKHFLSAYTRVPEVYIMFLENATKQRKV